MLGLGNNENDKNVHCDYCNNERCDYCSDIAVDIKRSIASFNMCTISKYYISSVVKKKYPIADVYLFMQSVL